MYQDHELVWVDTTDVKVGDRIACLLSDAEAYCEVTGWSDRLLRRSRYGLPDVTHRHFRGVCVPWWADDHMRHDLAGKTLIMKREKEGNV